MIQWRLGTLVIFVWLETPIVLPKMSVYVQYTNTIFMIAKIEFIRLLSVIVVFLSIQKF